MNSREKLAGLFIVCSVFTVTLHLPTSRLINIFINKAASQVSTRARKERVSGHSEAMVWVHYNVQGFGTHYFTFTEMSSPESSSLRQNRTLTVPGPLVSPVPDITDAI